MHSSERVLRLQPQLTSLLGGLQLAEWIESTAMRAIAATGQGGPPLAIHRGCPLLQSRRVTQLRYNVKLPEIARLIVHNNGFVIEVSTPSHYQLPWFRFYVSHEISHTLLYNIETHPPFSLVNLEPGNSDLEWLCDSLAKRILVPETWLRKHLAYQPHPGDEMFALSSIFETAKAFGAPWQVILERTIEDTGMWNCVVLRFALSTEERQPDSEEREVWRMTWNCAPRNGCTGLYIPRGQQTRAARKYPRADGKLGHLLGELAERGHSEPYFSCILDANVFNISTTGNLGKFLKQRHGTTDILAHCAVRVPVDRLFPTELAYQQGMSILICMPIA
jgi:hypothetical protein